MNNFGFVEFLLDFHVGMLFGVRDGRARAALVAPFPTRRKVELLQDGLEHIPKPETRSLVADACKLIRNAISPRNDMLHGIWGMDGYAPGGRAICANTKKGTYRMAEEVSPTADKLAIASRLLIDALVVDQDLSPNVFPETLLLEP